MKQRERCAERSTKETLQDDQLLADVQPHIVFELSYSAVKGSKIRFPPLTRVPKHKASLSRYETVAGHLSKEKGTSCGCLVDLRSLEQ